MIELQNAKAELLAELDELKLVDINAEIEKKVAEKKAELDAQLDAFKSEITATEIAEHENALAELNVGIKYIERAIARAEAAQAETVEVETVSIPADSLE